MLWRLITHHDHDLRDDALNWYRNHHIIALGWGHIGDLRLHHIYNQEGIVNLYWNTYGNTGNNNNCGSCKRSLWRLWREMEIDDLVILVTKRRVRVVRVIGDYVFDQIYPFGVDAQSLEGYCNRRTVEDAGDAQVANNLWDRHTPESNTFIYDALIKLVP